MISKKYSLSQKGFTLVELLIVIVIIGILAGVVIGVLNPVQQQNRARDAGLRAHLDKMALSAKSLYASSPRTSNRAPTGNEFIKGIANADTPDAGNDCTLQNDPTAATSTCNFLLTGITLPNGTGRGCEPSGNTGTGNTQCHYSYYRTLNSFKIQVRGFAQPFATFSYYYTEDPDTGEVTEGFWTCSENFAASTIPSVAQGCTSLTD